MRRASLAVLGLLGVSAGGCTSSSGSAAATSGGDAGLGCSYDTKVQAYAADMGQLGTGGALRFVLAEASPPPTTTDTTGVWKVKLLDASGAPVSDATFPVMRPWMPYMNHGTATVTVTSDGDGVYTLSPVDLFMPGVWEVDMTAQSGTTKDSTSFFFCAE